MKEALSCSLSIPAMELLSMFSNISLLLVICVRLSSTYYFTESVLLMRPDLFSKQREVPDFVELNEKYRKCRVKIIFKKSSKGVKLLVIEGLIKLLYEG